MGFPTYRFDNEDNIEKFCIDARDLYKDIIQSDDTSHFSRWMKRALKNYHFEENLDFIMIRPIGLTRVFEVFHGITIINTFVKISHKIPIDRNLTVEDCTYCTTYP